VWLHLEGTEGIKDFILDEFGLRETRYSWFDHAKYLPKDPAK